MLDGIPGPDEDDRFDAWRAELVSDFERSLPQARSELDPNDLGLLLDWKRSSGGGDLRRWRRSDVEQFLLDWCPAKLSASAEDVASLPAAVGLAISFLGDRGLIGPGSESVSTIARHAVGLQRRFMTAMADPSTFGMAKSLFAGLDLGPGELTQANLDAAVARFNTLPEPERRARTGGGPPAAHAPDDLVIGPVVVPDERTLRQAALASPAMQGFVALGDYFAAPGRQLTATGNLRLADARALVDLLGTGDAFHDRATTARGGGTRSASQLPALDHWKWWATQTGVLRPVRGRLVAVEAWRGRARKDPLGVLLRAFQLLADVGPLRSERWWLDDPVAETLDSSFGPLLGRLLAVPQGLAYDELLSEWRSMLDAVGVVEWFPTQVETSFSLFIGVLERSGFVLHHDRTTSQIGYGAEVRRGGTLVLSPVGIAFAVDLVEQEGVTVERVPAPQGQTVAGLVALAGRVDLDGWWRTVLTWLDVQGEQDSALEALLTGLDRADDLAVLPVVLEEAPRPATERILPTMRRLAASDDPGETDLVRLAAAWVSHHGEPTDGWVDDEAVLIGSMVALGRLAVDSPERLTEALAGHESARDTYGFISLVGARLPSHAVDLLEAIGSAHPDKAIAKAARKELFRVRSKLVQRSPRRS